MNNRHVFTGARVLPALRVAGIVLVVISATTLPLAMYIEPAKHISERFTFGALMPLPLIICASSLLLTVLMLKKESHVLNMVNATFGGSLVAVTVLVALSKISDANHVSYTSTTFNDTYWGVGIKIALLGAGAIIGASVAGMNEAKGPVAESQIGGLSAAATIECPTTAGS